MSSDLEPSSSGFLRHILQTHEEKLMDPDKFICLLCKRKFKTSDLFRRHRLSNQHDSRLKKLRQRLFSEEQLDKIERKERETLYRDRAKERRLKYGIAEPLLPSTSDLSIESSPIIRHEPPFKPLPDNKGVALMSKMGWREGLGLGKSNEGMTDIIKLDSQRGTAGLGAKVKTDYNLSYKEAVKKVMYQRYHDLTEEE